MHNPPNYQRQARYVEVMMAVLGNLIAAASHSDADVVADCSAFADGTTFEMGILGSPLKMRLRASEGRLAVIGPHEVLERPTDIMIAFKHITYAYRVFAFRETTAEAFSRDRLISRGDTHIAMRLTRCINRAQSLAIPLLPLHGSELSTPARLWGTARLYSKLVRLKTMGA